MVSRCCSFEVSVEGHTTHYYVCNNCGRATDLKEMKDESVSISRGHGDSE